MKTVEELGISPMPWKVVPYNHTMDHDTPILGDVESCGESIIEDTRLVTYPNARLIASAPELYKALRDMSMTMANFVCSRMLYCKMCEKNVIECVLSNAKEALAKAGGEGKTE